MTPKTLNDYLTLPYKVEVVRNDDGFFARVIDLPGCMTWANRIEDLWPLVEDAKRAWIDDALASGDEVPRPRPQEAELIPAIVQLPEPLARRLAGQAKREGVSLDALVEATLRQVVGG